jgi:N-acetylglucosaminyldiphosphoundecaprenol N-acetyl-beta-D-mannosaminyltransferase
MRKAPLRIPGPYGRSPVERWRSTIRRRAYPVVVLLGAIVPRAIDLLVGGAVLLLLSPLLLPRALRSRRQTGTVLSGRTLIGRYQTPFRRVAFAGAGSFRGLAVWLNVFRGEMAIVGPRPLTPQEAKAVPVADLVRFTVRPGLISPFRVRSRIGIAHERESAMDRDLVYAQTVRGDLGLAARSIVSGALGGGAPRSMPPVLNLFGIPVVNTTMANAVDWMVTAAAAGDKRLIYFVNPDCLNIAWQDDAYRVALQQADCVLPDGIGIHLGCRMLGQALRANVNGTDLFPVLCEAAASADLPVFLLGARPGTAQAVADNMVARYPTLSIAGTRHGYFDPAEEAAVIDEINRSGTRILLVAFGAPRQEIWLRRCRDRLAVPVGLGVGGLFDFYSGRIPRAPIWMREMGLEWVYRLLQEPGRMWRRYVIGNPLFLLRVRQQLRHPERFPLPAATAAGLAGWARQGRAEPGSTGLGGTELGGPALGVPSDSAGADGHD